ncbi:MAG: [acyl-carrier-protein] S-malonyltransferase [Synechococcus sp. XM-24]|nr:MAG: [acyl-carrier-protein] S-malonyltransferase [Synechococcus sp. XM-24]
MANAWVFPGQGSQKVGMAAGVLELPGAKERFEAASTLLGRDLLAICEADQSERYGFLGELGKTRNTQPALFVVESLLVDELKRQGRKAALIAGHSLGEITALYAAGVVTAEAAMGLIAKRSVLMSAARGGAMTAVMGFDRRELEALVEMTEGVVIANDNSNAQVVLSGSVEAVNNVSRQLKCKRAIPLAVSGAFHSPFMQQAADAFSQELDAIAFADASIPVLSNTDPTPETSGASLKARLRSQMTTGVRWRETMEAMTAAGITTAVEIGPGNVLSGLIKRSTEGITNAQIATAADLGL